MNRTTTKVGKRFAKHIHQLPVGGPEVKVTRYALGNLFRNLPRRIGNGY